MPPIFKFEGNKSGGPGRDRTGDLLHAMQALSQLSYRPVQILYQIFQHICGKGVLFLEFFASCVFLVNFIFSFPRVPQVRSAHFTSWYTSSQKK